MYTQALEGNCQTNVLHGHKLTIETHGHKVTIQLWNNCQSYFKNPLQQALGIHSQTWDTLPNSKHILWVKMTSIYWLWQKCIQTESPPHKRISTPRSNSDKNSEYNSDCLSELTDLLSESDHDEPEKPTVGKVRLTSWTVRNPQSDTPQGKQHRLALDQDEPEIPKAKRVCFTSWTVWEIWP